MKLRIFGILKDVFLLVLLWGAIFWLVNSGCTKHQPHEPPVDVTPDTVHVHHNHEIVVVDTIFQDVICDIVDLTIEFIVIGDQSAPNIYAYFLNGIEVGRFVVEETFAQSTDVKFEVELVGLMFGDVITINVIEGSQAAVVGSSIIKIKCSFDGSSYFHPFRLKKYDVSEDGGRFGD